MTCRRAVNSHPDKNSYRKLGDATVRAWDNWFPTMPMQDVLKRKQQNAGAFLVVNNQDGTGKGVAHG